MEEAVALKAYSATDESYTANRKPYKRRESDIDFDANSSAGFITQVSNLFLHKISLN